MGSIEHKASFKIQKRGGTTAVVLEGDWTSVGLGRAPDLLREQLRGAKDVDIDASQVREMDTAGAYSVIRATGGKLKPEDLSERPRSAKLVELVLNAQEVTHRPDPPSHPLIEILARAGQALVGGTKDFFHALGFTGQLIVTLMRSIIDPRRLRWASIFSLMERAGLVALPVVAVTSFFIGAVVGLLGANMLSQFGAQVYTVELVGIGVLREFGVLITAVLLAGRSASAFAAEIGSMKMNQEIDAMRVLGVDIYEALVIPRFIAMLVMTPLLTFVAVCAGLAGGMLVTWSMLDLSPSFFLQRVWLNVGEGHFLVGLSKAPVLAAVIAAIGCRQGLAVGGDVESLGRHVTAAVVHAIFAIILLDAVFALVYMELDI